MREQSTDEQHEKKEVRRDGSIKELIDGKKYKIRVYVGCNQAGKRRYFSQVFRGTSKQATRRLNAIVLDIDNGIIPTRAVPESAAPVLLSEALERWLKHKTTNRKARIRTVRNYEWLLNTYVKPVIGSKPVTEITELDIQNLYNGLSERGISAKTIRNLHKVLEPALTRAVGWKLLPENPAEHAELPAWERKEAKYLTAEQTLSFLNVAKRDKWYVAFLIAIETGARPNEYLALRWSDIDFDNRSLSIRRSLYWPPGLGRKKPGNGAFEFTKPKTQRSNRTITINPPAIEVLRQHRLAQLEQRMRKGSDYQDHGLVFATELGTPLLWRNLDKRHLKPLLAAALIPSDGISMYTMRHTNATLQIISGVHIRVIAERLGTSVAMIDITYSHVAQTLQQSASDSLARLLYGT